MAKLSKPNPATAKFKPKPKAGRTPKIKKIGDLVRTSTDISKQSAIQDAFRSPFGGPPIKTMEEQELQRERDILERTLLEERRELGKANFWYFLTEILFPDVWQDHYSEGFHKEICDGLQNLKKGEDFWLFLPRKRRKSYICSLAHTLWLIIRDPNIRILSVGAKERTVKRWSMLIRSALIPGTAGFERFQQTYPEHMLSRNDLRKALEWTVPTRTKVLGDPTFRATYVGATEAGGRCISPETLIHTSKGLIPAKRIEVGTRVLTMKGQYRRVLEKATQPLGDRKVLRFDITGFPVSRSSVTEDHPVATWSEDGGVVFKEAKDVRVGDYVPIPKPKNTYTGVIFKDQEKLDQFQEMVKFPLFWRLLGYYAAEGWRHKGTNRVTLAFAKGEDEYIADVCEAVTTVLGVPVNKNERDNVCNVSWSHKLFSEIVGQIGDGALNKRVPYWVSHTAKKNQKEFITGYFNGDAGVSVSLSLLADTQHMLAGLNERSSLGVLREAQQGEIRGRVVNQKRTYNLQRRANEPTRDPQSWFTPNYWVCRVRGIEEDTAPIREVFDFKVEEDSTLVALGLPIHNCDVLKFNDPVERRNVTNAEMSSKVLTQMLDFIPLLDDTGDYMNTHGEGTRWSFHDPYGAILGEREDDGGDEVQTIRDRLASGRVKIMVRHAGEDPERMCEHCPPHVVRAYPHGHPSMEENAVSCSYPVHTMEHVWEDHRRYMTDPNLGEALFYHQLMNVCMAPSEQKFQKEWFIDADIPAWPAPKRRALVVDSADKDFQKLGQGDWMVALMGEYDDMGRLMVRYGLRSRSWTRDEFIRRIITWCQATGWYPNLVVKEKFGSDTFLTDVGKAFTNIYHPVYVIAAIRPDKQKKLDWICESLQAPMERGDIVWGCQVPREVRSRAETELVGLGQVVHEDVADALALFMQEKVKIRGEKRPDRLQQQQWNAPNLGLYNFDRPAQPLEPPTPDPTPTESLREEGGTLVIQPGAFEVSGPIQWEGSWTPPRVGERMPMDKAPEWARSKKH